MVWPNFPIPESSLVADMVFSTRDHTFLRNPLISDTIQHHCLNQFIQIVAPVHGDVDHVKKLLRHHCPRISRLLLADSSHTGTTGPPLTYFIVRHSPIHLLLHPAFIKNYVLKGSTYILSECQNVDQDDCIVLLPTGVMHISLRTKSYHRFGLVGCESILNAKKTSCGNRYVITINLKDPLITRKFEKQKYYVKLFTSFHNSGMRMNLLTRWIPDPTAFPAEQVPHPESIVMFFQHMKGNPEDGSGFMSSADAQRMEIVTCRPSVRRFENEKQLIPNTLLDFRTITPSDCLMSELVSDADDWIGCQVCSITPVKDENSMDVSSFGFDASSCRTVASVFCCQTAGFFTPEDVTSLISEINAAMDILSDLMPFISVTVSGFEDSPISWSYGERSEHGKDLSGENSYTVLMACKSHPIPRCLRLKSESGSGDTFTANNEHIRKTLVIRRADAYDFSIQRL